MRKKRAGDKNRNGNSLQNVTRAGFHLRMTGLLRNLNAPSLGQIRQLQMKTLILNDLKSYTDSGGSVTRGVTGSQVG
jgi:hypothetical protein